MKSLNDVLAKVALPADDEVHIWRMPLDRGVGEIDRLRSTLSPDEEERARRFKFDRHRHDFIAARGLLRAILGAYLDMQAGALTFVYGDHGKPELRTSLPQPLSPPGGLNRITFNVSHSHGLALYAVASGRSVGVDVEQIRGDFGGEDIAKRFFSESEVRAFMGLPPEQRTRAFFLCWTRKEAIIKARGDGLFLALDTFDVSLAPGEPAALLRIDDDDPQRWDLRDIDAGDGYAAAVAAAGLGWRIVELGEGWYNG